MVGEGVTIAPIGWVGKNEVQMGQGWYRVRVAAGRCPIQRPRIRPGRSRVSDPGDTVANSSSRTRRISLWRLMGADL